MRTRTRRREGGYAMVALLLALGVIAVLIGMAMPMWRTMLQREREEELIFRGRQYARAVQLFQRKFAGAYPPSVDFLVDQHFLRKKYTDPMTRDGQFEIVYQGTLLQRQAAAGGRGATTPMGVPVQGRAGTTGQLGRSGTGFSQQPGSAFGSQATGPQGGVVGVASKSKEKSLRIFDGRTVYSEWQFVWVPSQQMRTGPAGAGQRGIQPGVGQPGSQRGRGPGGAGSPFNRPPG